MTDDPETSPARPAARRHDDREGRNAGGPSRADGGGRVWLYGRHAVAAALANPARRIRRLAATKNAADWLADQSLPPERLGALEDLKPDAIDRLLHAGAVHQGLALETDDLPWARLKEACEPARVRRPVVVLDQITDPQNIGAIFRSAAAFGAAAVVVQDRRTPPLSGALAKAAAGAVESVPCVRVVNIARALEGLKGVGYFCAGLGLEGTGGAAATTVAALPIERPLALVMGAEGAGLRALVAATCDAICRIPIHPRMESLNVSTAAAVALYEATRGALD